MKQITVGEGYTRAASLCSRGERAKSDILGKLNAWGLPPGEAQVVVERLVSENFINEHRYAHAYAHDKHLYNGWGRIKIAHQLRGKGIGEQDIAEALADIDEESYREMLERLLQVKWREVQGREPLLARAALLRFASGRGYESGIIYPLVDRIMSSRDD